MERRVEITVSSTDGIIYTASCTADGAEWMRCSAGSLNQAIDTALHYAGVHLGDEQMPFEELLEPAPPTLKGEDE